MKQKLLRCLPFWVLFMLIFVVRADEVQASYSPDSHRQEDVLPGIDLIVLLDHSPSMTGDKGTDPDERRIYTTQYLIDYMAFDNKYVNPQRSNRVVVIGFGLNTVIQVPLTTVKDDNAVEAAKNKVTALPLDGTNFVAALDEVRKVFPAASDQEVIDGIRQRIIVVITDGGPDTGGDLTYDQHFNLIRQAYFETNNLDEYYPLYVVSIDDSGQYWGQVGPLWQGFAIRAEKVDDVNKVNSLVADILCSFLNPAGGTSTCRLQQLGAHFVQPYARVVSFSFFKYTADEEIILQRPDITTVNLDPQDPDIMDHRSTRRDEMFVMSDPQAGCWFSSAHEQGGGQVDVITQVIFNDLRMVQPSSAHPRVLPLNLAFELRNEGGELVDENPNFPISIEAVLIGPDGTQQAVNIQRTTDANGRPIPGQYQSSTIPNLPISGSYSLVVRGFTSPTNLQAIACLNSAEPIRVFENTYEIPVLDAGFQIVSPAQPFLQYSPVDGLTVSYLDDDNDTILMPDEAPWELELVAESPSGAFITLPPPKLENGLYVVDEPLVFSESGEYRLTATLRNPETNEILDTVYTTFQSAVKPLLTYPADTYPAYAMLQDLRIQLADLQGNNVAASADFLLRLEAELLWPDGGSRTETVQFVATNRIGEYTSPVHWILTDPGSYTLNVRGYIYLSQVDERLAFEYPLMLNISASIPYFKVISPDSERPVTQNIYPLHKGLLPVENPMPLRVEIWRGNTLVAPDEAFVNNPGELVHVIVRGPGDQVLIDRDLPLTEDGQALEFLAAELTETGNYTATFTFQGDLIGGLKTEDLWPDADISFVRQDPTWVRWVWGILIFLAAAAVLAFIGWAFWEFGFATKVVGTLVAEYPGTSSQPIKEFAVGRKRRHTVTIKKGELGELRLKHVKIIAAKIIYEPLKAGESSKKQREIKQAEAYIEATNLEGKLVARGKLTASAQRQTPIPCQQNDVAEKKYQFKLKI